MAARKKRKVDHELATELYSAIRDRREDWRRPHLGASLLGHRCDRYLWLVFRWAFDPGHDGKRLRIFERGDIEEARVVRDLRAAMVDVSDRDPWTGQQYLVSWGHYGGHADGIVKECETFFPEQEGNGLLEVKTHNAKSYERLVERGIKSSKPEHYAQMQLYMKGLGLSWALYIAVNKDTEDLHPEIVDFDDEVATELLMKAKAITEMATPPDRKEDREQPPCVYVSKDGTRWPCDAYELCWGKQMPERNCRTCVHSTPSHDATFKVPCWNCAEHGVAYTGERGCDRQQSIPAIVNADIKSITDDHIIYQFADGERVTEKKGC